MAGYGIYSATQTAAKHGEISDLKKEVKRLGIVKQHFKIYEKANTQNYFVHKKLLKLSKSKAQAENGPAESYRKKLRRFVQDNFVTLNREGTNEIIDGDEFADSIDYDTALMLIVEAENFKKNY